MKRILLNVMMLSLVGALHVNGQQPLTVSIVQTDEIISDSIWVEDPVTEEDTLWGVVSVPLSSDDAEEIHETLSDEGPVIDDLNDDDLDVGWEGEPEDLNIVNVGLRFQDITIPQGSFIDSAYIEVVSHESKSEDDVANITIVGEASDNAETFTEDALISDRPATDASVYWVVDEEWGLWTTERTPDIKDIIQEIVDRDGWQSGNSLAIIMKGENQGVSEDEHAREFEAFENISDPEDGGDGQNHPERVPKLVVYYSDEATSIQGNIPNSAVKLYPNPVSGGIFNIYVGKMIVNQVNIYDITGKHVMKIEDLSVDSRHEINVSKLYRGLYFVEIEGEVNKLTKKLLVK